MLKLCPASPWISSSSWAIFCANTLDMRFSTSVSMRMPVISICASTGIIGRSSVWYTVDTFSTGSIGAKCWYRRSVTSASSAA